jgi:hypothetical protein
MQKRYYCFSCLLIFLELRHASKGTVKKFDSKTFQFKMKTRCLDQFSKKEVQISWNDTPSLVRTGVWNLMTHEASFVKSLYGHQPDANCQVL